MVELLLPKFSGSKTVAGDEAFERNLEELSALLAQRVIAPQEPLSVHHRDGSRGLKIVAGLGACIAIAATTAYAFWPPPPPVVSRAGSFGRQLDFSAAVAGGTAPRTGAAEARAPGDGGQEPPSLAPNARPSGEADLASGQAPALAQDAPGLEKRGARPDDRPDMLGAQKAEGVGPSSAVQASSVFAEERPSEGRTAEGPTAEGPQERRRAVTDVPARPADGEAASGAAEGQAADAPSLTMEEISEAQTYLQQLKYGPGPIDGIAGPLTTAAVARFNEASGHTAPARVDRLLLARLREALGAPLSLSDRQ